MSHIPARFINFTTLKLFFRGLPCKHNVFHDAVLNSRWSLSYGMADKRRGFWYGVILPRLCVPTLINLLVQNLQCYSPSISMRTLYSSLSRYYFIFSLLDCAFICMQSKPFIIMYAVISCRLSTVGYSNVPATVDCCYN